MGGISPDGAGRFSPVALDQPKEVGDWLKVNGEAVYGSRPRSGNLWREGAPLAGAGSAVNEVGSENQRGENPPIRLTGTKDNGTLYAISLGWPGMILHLKTVPRNYVRDVKMLGLLRPLNIRSDGADGSIIGVSSAG